MYDVIELLRPDFGVAKLCEVLGVSRSAFYAYSKGSTYRLSDQKSQVGQAVKNVFDEHERRYGWRRIQAELATRDIAVGRHQIRSRMQE